MLWASRIRFLRTLFLNSKTILERVSSFRTIKRLMELSSKNSFLQSRFKPAKILISKLISKNILSLLRQSLIKTVLSTNKFIRTLINNTSLLLLNSDVNSPIVNSSLDLFSLFRRKRAPYGKTLKINKFSSCHFRMVPSVSISLIQLSEMSLDLC